MSNRDATYNPTFDHPEFTPLFKRVTWREGNGLRRWTHLFAPSNQACSWDGAEWATAAVGITNIFEDRAAFAYCDLRITGRKERLIPGTGGYSAGSYGMKAKITFNKGTDDENTFDCWVSQCPKDVN